MKKEKLEKYIRRALRDPARADIGLFAANGAYYLFLSLGPLTALFVSLLPYTPLTEQQLLDGVLIYAPAPMRRLVYAVVRDVYAGPAAALGLSAALELWSGARFLASVVRGVGELCGGGAGGYFRRRAVGAAYTAALMLFVLGNLMLLLFGQRLMTAAAEKAPRMEAFWGLVLRLRRVIIFLGLTAGNALLFRYAPGGRGRLCRRLPGAAFSAAGWLAFSRAYSWALERFGLFGVYGSIAAVVVSLYWAYISLYILFLGAWLNTVIYPDVGLKSVIF